MAVQYLQKMEWYERYHFASLQELEFKCYTLNSAIWFEDACTSIEEAAAQSDEADTLLICTLKAIYAEFAHSAGDKEQQLYDIGRRAEPYAVTIIWSDKELLKEVFLADIHLNFKNNS